MRVTRAVIDKDALAEQAALCAGEYGVDAPGANIEHLRWRYLECPAGNSYADELRVGDDLVGRIVFWPRSMRSNAGSLAATNPVELLIDRAHRSPRAFLDLMRGLRDHDNADLIYLAPNDTSAPLYEKLLGFEPVGTLSLTGMPLRPEHVLHERLGRLTRGLIAALGVVWRVMIHATVVALRTTSRVDVSSDRPDDAALDALAALLYRDDVWVGARDHEFHQWRFFDSPVFQYRVRYASRRGELMGYAVSRVAEFEGLRACVILDCVAVGSGRRSAGRALRADAVRRACTDRADLVAALGFGDAAVTASLGHFPLVRVPRRFWPERMDVLAEWLGTRRESEPPPVIALTLADMDVF